MCERALVLDTSVLSSFASAGWFEDLDFWHPDRRLLTSRRIWAREFRPHHDHERPAWLDVERAHLSAIDERSVRLGDADWSLLALATDLADPILVTNDRTVTTVADDREVDWLWGTKFALRTFEACGISTSEFRDGLSAYTDDVFLPGSVIEELSTAEKV